MNCDTHGDYGRGGCDRFCCPDAVVIVVAAAVVVVTVAVAVLELIVVAWCLCRDCCWPSDGRGGCCPCSWLCGCGDA